MAITKRSVTAMEYSERLILANRVAQGVELLDIQLIDISARLQPFDDWMPGDIKLGIDTKTRVRDDKSGILVLVTVDLQSNDTDGTAALHIQATFKVLYKCEPTADLTEAHFNAFGELNGLVNAWPFLRELIQSITSRMGLPPLTLPVRKPALKESDLRRSSPVSPKLKSPPKKKTKSLLVKGKRVKKRKLTKSTGRKKVATETPRGSAQKKKTSAKKKQRS